MSHLHERKEKKCLNCGADLYDRYCHKCGQENVEPKENFLHLTQHFLEDVTHFDGKLFTTVRALILKPGFLTQEYIKGRRATYINPIRLYLFISALFFLLLMSFFIDMTDSPLKITRNENNTSNAKADSLQSVNDSLSFIKDSADLVQAIGKGTNTDNVLKSLKGKRNQQVTTMENDQFAPEKNLATYDSTQKALPADKKDGWLKHHFKRKMIATRDLTHTNEDEVMHKFKERFFHSVPYMLFLSLPLIALLLKLLYVRRKQFFYVSHIIFLLHFYCLVFVSLIITRSLHTWCGTAGAIISGVIYLGVYVYLYAAMKRFYQQGWFKTLIKFFLLLFFGMFILVILGILFAANSFLNTGGV